MTRQFGDLNVNSKLISSHIPYWSLPCINANLYSGTLCNECIGGVYVNLKPFVTLLEIQNKAIQLKSQFVVVTFHDSYNSTLCRLPVVFTEHNMSHYLHANATLFTQTYPPWYNLFTSLVFAQLVLIITCACIFTSICRRLLLTFAIPNNTSLRNVPLNKVSVLLPEEVYEGNEMSCPICIESVLSGEIIKTLKCHHIFHLNCIDTWLINGNKCPLCNDVIY